MVSGTVTQMNFSELTDAFFMQSAGWQAVKQARSILAGGQVISSNWSPPLLKGVVQEGSTSYRAGLVIHGPDDMENLCTCRAARAGCSASATILRMRSTTPSACRPRGCRSGAGAPSA